MDIILKREVYSNFQLWYRPLSRQRYAFLSARQVGKKPMEGKKKAIDTLKHQEQQIE